MTTIEEDLAIKLSTASRCAQNATALIEALDQGNAQKFICAGAEIFTAIDALSRAQMLVAGTLTVEQYLDTLNELRILRS